MNIDKIILKLFRKTNSLEELEILESWKKESDENLAFMQLMNMKGTDSGFMDFDSEKAWSRLNKRISGHVARYVTVAAALLIIGFLAFYIYKNFSGQDQMLPHYAAAESIEHVILNDQSNVWLNRNSEIKQLTPFDSERRISFTGEAFFDISHNKELPFIIAINEEDFVKVIGTSFNLVNNDNSFDLIVYSGKVELHVDGANIPVEKDYRVSRVNGSYVNRKNNDLNASSWKTGELIFENTSLQKIIDALERHYSCRFEYKGLDFSGCDLVSRFKNQSLDKVLAELKVVFGMKYRRSGKTIIIEELNCM